MGIDHQFISFKVCDLFINLNANLSVQMYMFHRYIICWKWYRICIEITTQFICCCYEALWAIISYLPNRYLTIAMKDVGRHYTCLLLHFLKELRLKLLQINFVLFLSRVAFHSINLMSTPRPKSLFAKSFLEAQ